MQVPFLSPEDMDTKVEAALQRYRTRFGGSLPVKIEQFLETEYQVQIIPLPGIRDYSLECGLSLDGKTVLIDGQLYFETEGPGYLRTRFGFAHELAHLELHSPLLPSIPPHDYAELSTFLENFDELSHNNMEVQANMFAARFLMPTPDVMGALAAQVVQNMALLRENGVTLEQYARFIAPTLATQFEVSSAAMSNRLKNLDYSAFTTGKSADILIAECDQEALRSLSTAATPLPEAGMASRPMLAS